MSQVNFDKESFKLIESDNKALSYMGRIDFSDAKAPKLINAASNIRVRFTGTSLKVILKNKRFQDNTWIGAIVDGIQQKIEMKPDCEPYIYTLAEGLEDKEHTVTLFKRMAGAHYVFFCGFIIDKNAVVVPTDDKYDMKLEVYGDSVSAGEVCEAIYYEGQSDPSHNSCYDNSWFSYPYSLARKLNAELHNISQGGLALFDGTGYYCSDMLTGLESTYDKLSYSPYDTVTPWDFSLYTPDLVIIAIGQNDHNPNPDAIYTPEYSRKWKDKYIEIVRDLQKKYTNTKFLLTMTVLKHYPIWDTVLDEVCAELNDENVKRFRFRRNGLATDGHPRVTEQEEMAMELYSFVTEWFGK